MTVWCGVEVVCGDTVVGSRMECRRSVSKGAGTNCVSVERASVAGVFGSWTIELECETLGKVGEGRLVLIMKVLGFQSNCTKVDGSWLVGRRGTIDPFARRKRVLPVVKSGPRHTPSSVLGSVLVAV